MHVLTFAGQRMLRNVADAAHGTKRLSQEDLNTFLLPIPSSGEQSDIVTILDAIDRKIDLHRKKRALLEELFKSLLHKLMTGEIRVSDLDLSALEAQPA
jgi:type I restriction enzyme S subunit